jgi:hypothetical protein
MCFTLSHVSTTGRWNWEGDEIVHDPIILASRLIPNEKKRYDIDIREFLLTKDNAVIGREIGKIISALPFDRQAFFRSHSEGSFDYRVQVITSYMAESITYIPGGRKLDSWLFPDETIERRGGDCEDRAFLMVALLLASGISGYVVRVALGKLYNKTKKRSKDHVWVMYRTEDGRWMCLEPLLLSKEARNRTQKLIRSKPATIWTEYDYIPYFVFNDTHLWRMLSNTISTTFTDYVQERKFWSEFRPEFAAEAHNNIIDFTLSDMSYADRIYLKAYSLALDTLMSYDPREHFDNGYIKEGWDLILKRLKAVPKTLNNLAGVIHSAADFYAHTSYAEFAPKIDKTEKIALYDEAALAQMQPDYGIEPFNLFDKNRFTVNTHFYKSKDRKKAVAYCDEQQIISGRFAQTHDPFQSFLEKNFVYIPYEMRNAPDFPDRGSLPHHDEIAVDARIKEDEPLPEKHKLYQDRNEFQSQFELRFDAAKRHITKLYEEWKK